MKKIVLLFVSFLLVCVTTATESNNYLLKLSNIESSDMLETVSYSYLSNYLLETTNTTMDDGTQLIDSIFYDEMGNPILIKFFQLINNQWRWTSYVESTYDENGNRTSRSNYNNFGNDFELGGTYHYTYNSSNQLTNWDLYMAGELSQICNLTYNDEGFVIEEIGQASNWGSPMENSWKLDYQYDANNNCISKEQSFWNGYGWDVYGVDLYFYDANNNCIKRDKLIGNVVVDRHEYTYDTEYTFDKIVFPENPESSFPEFVQMKHCLVLEQWYTEDNNGELVYVCDYMYNYETIEHQNVPVISVSPESLEFLHVSLKNDDGILTVSNSGDADGEFVATITGENADMFTFQNENQAVIAPNDSYDLTVSVINGNWNEGIYHAVIVFETNDPENPEIEIPVTLEIQVGINEIKNTVSIFPNPVTTLLNLSAEGIQSVSLYDILGHQIYQTNTTSKSFQMDVSGLEPGFYIVRITLLSGKVETERIVIKH